MIEAVVALALIVVALLVLRERDARRLEGLLVAQAEERRSLSDRLQFPEQRQIAPIDSEPQEIPKDAAELAFVGQIVPTGYDVGDED